MPVTETNEYPGEYVFQTPAGITRFDGLKFVGRVLFKIGFGTLVVENIGTGTIHHSPPCRIIKKTSARKNYACV